jgi:hypothetical protein
MEGIWYDRPQAKPLQRSEFLMVYSEVGIDINSELRKIVMINIEYLTNQNGEAIGVVIPNKVLDSFQ